MRCFNRISFMAYMAIAAVISPGIAADDPFTGWAGTTLSVGSIQNVSCGWASGETLWVYGGGTTGWYRSADEGLTWERLGTGVQGATNAGNFYRVFAAPQESGLLYAGSYGQSIRVSEDNGDTWQSLPVQSTVEMITGLVNPLNSREAFIGLGDSGVARIHQPGGSWVIDTVNNTGTVFDMAMDPDDTDTVYLATYSHGISRLVRMIGDFWQFQDDGQSPAQKMTAICIDPDAPATIYAGCSREYGGKVWRGDISTSESVAWTPLPEFNPDWRIDALVCPVSGDIDLLAASNGRLVAYRASAGTWTPMDTPVRDGNRVYSMEMSPATGNLLLGTDSGCYAFIPDLNTWQIRNHGLRNILVNKILVYPSNSMSMVMATEGNGIFVSRDGGNTWIASNPGLANLFVRDIARDPLDPARLYAAHLKGFARSDDGGVSWTQPWSQELQAERIVPLVQNNQTVLLLGHRDPDAPSLSTIYRSVDQGDTWTASTLPANPKNIREIIVDPVDPLTIFATGDSNNYWKSMDYGVSFDNWNPSGLSGGPTATIRLVIDPMNTQNMWACGRNSGVYRSVDGGDSFTSCAGTGGAIWPELAIDPTTPGRVFICSDEPIYNPPGMMVSVNGGESFTQVQEFPAGTALSSMNTDFNHDRIFVFDMTGNQYSFDPGAGVWLPQDNQYIQLPYTVTDYENDPFHPDTVYAATHGEGIWRSGDGGSTWQSIATGMENYPYVFSLDTDARQPGRLLAGASQPGFMTHKVFQSIDAGAHWTPLGNLPVVTGEIVDIDILDESIGQNDIWIVTYGDGVFISMNSGSDWESRSIIPSPPGSYITSVTHSFYGSQEEPWIHVASHGGEGAFIYDPNNEVFMPNNTGLPRDVATGFIFIDRILADPASPGTLYAAISDGTLYKTDNNGALWYAERSGTCPGWTVHRTGINQVRKRYTVPPYRQSDVVFIGDVIVHGSVTGGVACKAPGSGWQTLPPTCLLPESWAYNYSLGAISKEDIITILMGTTMVDSPNLLSEQFSIPIASPALKIPCKKFAAGGFYRTETGNAAH